LKLSGSTKDSIVPVREQMEQLQVRAGWLRSSVTSYFT
jgi:hypothetical protein